LKGHETFASVVVFCNFSPEVCENSWEQETCVPRKGKIQHGASMNKPSDTIHNETSCWTIEILRASPDVHFSAV
jgi:hypothetical protein